LSLFINTPSPIDLAILGIAMNTEHDSLHIGTPTPKGLLRGTTER